MPLNSCNGEALTGVSGTGKTTARSLSVEVPLHVLSKHTLWSFNSKEADVSKAVRLRNEADGFGSGGSLVGWLVG